MMYNELFVFWTGDNPISVNREEAMASLREESEMPITLVTPDNLSDYIIDDIHPAYRYLSNVHKSDYLRAYFMHHHGGGYSDMKPASGSWKAAFERLNKSTAWVSGYRELGSNVVAECTGNPQMREKLRRQYRKLIGCCSFICKPHTEFTEEWLSIVEGLLTEYHIKLSWNPGNIMGDNPGYPLAWTQIMGDVFHPLILKYHDKVIYDSSVMPNLNLEYR